MLLQIMQLTHLIHDTDGGEAIGSDLLQPSTLSSLDTRTHISLSLPAALNWLFSHPDIYIVEVKFKNTSLFLGNLAFGKL